MPLPVSDETPAETADTRAAEGDTRATDGDTRATDATEAGSGPGHRSFRLGRALVAAALTALIVGIPTDIIPNPVFGREVPVRPWEAPVLAATAILTGLHFGLQRPGSEKSAPAISGAGLAMFAVACPVCNKLVLLALGTSGALGFWQPLQPWLAGLSLLMLGAAVAWAWRRNPCADGTCADGSCTPPR